jgi:hypothetical protein
MADVGNSNNFGSGYTDRKDGCNGDFGSNLKNERKEYDEYYIGSLKPSESHERKLQVINSVLKEHSLDLGDICHGQWQVGKIEGARDEGILVVKTMLFIGVSFRGQRPKLLFELLDLHFISTKTKKEFVVWDSSIYPSLEKAKKKRRKKLKKFLRSLAVPQEDIEGKFTALCFGRPFNFSLGQFKQFIERGSGKKSSNPNTVQHVQHDPQLNSYHSNADTDDKLKQFKRMNLMSNSGGSDRTDRTDMIKERQERKRFI